MYGNQSEYDVMGTESCILLSNHYSDVDWLMGWVVGERKNIVGVRYFFRSYVTSNPCHEGENRIGMDRNFLLFQGTTTNIVRIL